MRINDHCITVSAGHISINDPLVMGDTVTVVIEGDIVQVKQNDNQDGTYDLIYKVKGAIAEVKKHDKIISSEENTEL